MISIRQQVDFARRFFQKDDPEGKGKSDQKVPKGFEKFLRGSKKEEGSATQNKDSKDMKKEQDNKKKQDDEQLTEEEEESIESDKEKRAKEQKDKEDKEQEKGFLNTFYMDPNSGGPKWENIILTAFMAGAFGYYMLSNTPSQEITYMDFVNQYLSKNQVKMVTISEDKSSDMFKYKAEIETHDGRKVHLVLPQVENFLYKLDLAQREMGKVPNEFVPVKYASESSQSQQNSMLNFAIGGAFALILLQIYRSMHGKGPKGTGKGGKDASQGGSMFGGKGPGGLNDIFKMGQSNVTVYGVDKKIKSRFKHVAGMENAKQEVMEFVDFLKDPKKYTRLGAKVPRGALLVGPPGTGKTLLAKAVAGEAGVPFLSISGSDFVEMFVGVGASRVRDLFKKAREKAPSIIFIDEIDAVAKKRHGKFGGGNDERDNTLNQLLVEMDGFGTDESVIILAATNRADILDSALLRPGRFDRQVEITLPTIKDRTEIFKVHLKKIKLNKEYPREEYARRMATLTPGFSGADIANVCNEAAIIAARFDLESVGIKEFESATERVIGGLEKKTLITADEKKTVAYHESGHAVAGWFLEHSNPLLKITIIPRSKGSLGFAQYLPDELSLYSKDQLMDMMCTALGGRVSEEIFFGKITTGASDDIKKITQIALGLVTVYGMSPRMGLRAYQQEEMTMKPYSESTNEIIDEEVKRIVDECYVRTKALLESKSELIHNLAEELISKETVNLSDIVRILGERPYPLKESVREYLSEMISRQDKEELKKKENEATKQQQEQDAANTPSDEGKGDVNVPPSDEKTKASSNEQQTNDK